MQKLHVGQSRPPLKPNYLVLKTSDSGGTFKVPQSSIFTYLIWLGNDQDIIKRKTKKIIIRNFTKTSSFLTVCPWHKSKL